ncbi:hypothetical protein E6C67_08500 [Azospirillum sp. TSA2s]|uniref:hypothetical protein n=1 Tax=Azospirillum sp. TSA2s TaxID=709810 RepID=UPI0010AB02F9|nr:hypothetical protein [Azospirillum sp. TSA2s]QCG93978.1 hypothetical protein E6C67_08500 [Azospirillum sp. TSA2s]
MEGIISIKCGGRIICIGSLSRQTIVDAGAEHMGPEGYFIFTHDKGGIDVLAKAASIEAAFRLADIMAGS